MNVSFPTLGKSTKLFTICSNRHPLPSTSSPKGDLHQDRCISVELDGVLEKDGLKYGPT